MDSDVVRAGSQPAIRSSLDLFSIWPTDVSAVQSDFLPLFPINAYRDDSNLPVEFLFPKSYQYFMSGMESFLYAKVKVVKADGTDIVDTDVVAPGQYFAQQMIDTIHVFVNGTCTTSTPGFYPIRSTINNIISSNMGYQNSVLSQGMWYRDTKMDKFAASENANFRIRQNMAKGSKPFEIITSLDDFPFNNSRQLPPGCEIRVRLVRSDAAHALVGADAKLITPFPYKIVYEEIILYIKRYLVDLSVVKYHEEMLGKNNDRFNYPVYSTVVKTYTVASKSTSFLEIPFTGNCPSRVVVAMSSSDAQNGSLSEDQLTFKDFGLIGATLSISGDTRMERALKFDPDAATSPLMAYNMFLEAVPNIGNGHWLSREEFVNGAFMLAYQINPADANGYSRPLVGQLKIDLKWKTELAKSIQIFIVGRFASLIQLDKNLNCYVDHSVL